MKDEEPEEAPVEEATADEVEVPAPVPVDERRRRIWSLIRNAPKRADGAMVAVVTSAVEPWPHQLRAYKRMLESWPFRLLIADEVGLGKTIEAGLLIRHVWIAELAKRALIMVPKAVLTQWQSELYEKFNLVVPIYTGQSLRWPESHGREGPGEEKIGRSEWSKQPLVLVSSHLMRRQDREKELLDAEPWDLLVLDEAHHARRKAPGTLQEGPPNRLLRLMQRIKEKSQAMLLLSATPMQVHPVELFDLLDLLGLPAEWNRQVFLNYFETLGRNPDAAQLHAVAKLFQVTEQVFGALPETEIVRIGEGCGVSGSVQQGKVLSALRDPQATIPLKRLSTNQRQMALALLKAASPVRHRMSRHTRNLLREYHRLGVLETPIPDRVVEDLPVTLSTAERALYDAVEDYISDTYENAQHEKKTAVGFVMTIYRRRLASSFQALRQTLNNRLAQLADPAKAQTSDERLDEDVSQDETAEDVMTSEDAAAYEHEALQVEEREAIQVLLKSIAKLGTDSKALKLLEKLKATLGDGYDSAIVFTQYTDTMDFLREFLADRLDLPIGCYSSRGGETRDASGVWVKCDKERIKRLLREGTIKLLICTDAAGEGLNLQTCGVLVNYDLPWNPMKVEQRIGRIDRIGQRYPKIRVINLAYADTVEADVYFALSDRIQLFHGLVGKLQPILSQLPKEFEAAALRRREEWERSRHEAVQHVSAMVSEAEGQAFDIDEVSEADLSPPVMPAPPITPEDVTEVLRRAELLPDGVECQELDPGTFSLRVPGQAEAIRVTASPRVFDEHFGSHQMVIHDSRAFRRLLELVPAEAGGMDGEGERLADYLMQ